MKKRIPGQIEFGIIYGIIAVLALIAARFLPLLEIAPSCVFKGFTGAACPTCGTTRSLVHLAHGEVAASFAMNPLAALTVIVAVLYFCYSLSTALFDLPGLSLAPTRREGNLTRIWLVALVATNWFYLVMTL